MAKSPPLGVECSKGATNRILGAGADAAASGEAQPAARVDHQSDRDQHERAGNRGRPGPVGDHREHAGRDCCRAAGSGSAQPSALLAAGKARSDHSGKKLARAADELSRHESRIGDRPDENAQRRVGLVGRPSEDRHRRCRRPVVGISPARTRVSPGHSGRARNSASVGFAATSSRISRISVTWNAPPFRRSPCASREMVPACRNP